MQVLFILFVCFRAMASIIKGQPPDDINDLFPTIPPDATNLTYNINSTFDIGKIDLKKLTMKINSFNASLGDKTLNNTRRQVLHYNFMGKSWYKKASDRMTRQKTTDMMLQTIYMARHIMKELESSPYFSVKDTGYRIGFLYKKLLTLYEKVEIIYQIMFKKRNNVQVELHLKLHHKVAQLYTDFMYWWWVLVKVDGMHRVANNDPPTLPKHLRHEGGISDYERIIE